ncbi:MAG: Ppx/GppA phosphatase family protein [Melioribacteraceae bacterium]|nr:Ppx/GppA phosphatase family protein [Melioribacteraceae bacterium]
MFTNKNFAAVDIGTNSVHLIVVKILEHGNFEIIDREKEVIRLGEGYSSDIKSLNEDAINRTITALKRFKEIAKSHQAKIRAVATSAVREAKNKDIFVKKVSDETGIQVEIISGQEEARLIYLGILRAVPIYEKRTLCIDIGGGSTEFVLGVNGKIEFSRSMKIGAVRLTQKYFTKDKLTKSDINKCKEWVAGELFHVMNYMKKYGFEVCVGSSGTIQSTGNIIAELSKRKITPNRILNNFEFTKEELDKTADKILNAKTVEERKKIPGMDSKRADIFPAGIIILQTAFEQLGVEKLTISEYALREGIVIDTLQNLNLEQHKPRLSDIRYESVLQLAKTCYFDSEHSFHVTNLATKLYDDLIGLHKLENYTREYLIAASILHDIGHHISHNQHHKHSNYIIRNSELMGFNENEINIIANVARYHRKSHPKEKHEEYVKLSDGSKKIVNKLASILRLADALDRSHSQKINYLSAKFSGNEVHLTLNTNSNSVDIELWNLERRRELFEDVFDKKLIIKTNYFDREEKVV